MASLGESLKILSSYNQQVVYKEKKTTWVFPDNSN